MIAAAQYSSAAENRAAADTIRKRLMNPANLVRQLPAPQKAKVIPFYASQIPLWEREPQYFDAHITAWRHLRAVHVSRAAQPVKTYLEERAADFGFSYDDLVGQSRISRLCAVRHLITFEIRKIVAPKMSLPEIGKAFGGRDHSTVINSISKMNALGPEGRTALELRLRGSQKVPRNATGPSRPFITRRIEA